MRYIYIPETDSTNVVMKTMMRTHDLPEFTVIRTSFQTAGKGQPGNFWESERSRNLLFSILLKPVHIPIDQQFIITEMISTAIIDALKRILLQEEANKDLFKIKWPNDIYYGDKKIGGILIENSLQGGRIISAIIGIGLNINQLKFVSDAPNPGSLRQITNKRQSVIPLLHQIIRTFETAYLHADFNQIHQDYIRNLYRFREWHTFKSGDNQYIASIMDVRSDGRLILELKNGEIREYYFKEIAFVINP